MVAVPDLKIPELGEWVWVDNTRSVVCGHFADNAPWAFEVVYLDGEKALTKPVVWGEGGWSFSYAGPSGGHADNYPVFSMYVEKLRSG
jgi:hypothetical protein